jgi:hypothetical protein
VAARPTTIRLPVSSNVDSSDMTRYSSRTLRVWIAGAASCTALGCATQATAPPCLESGNAAATPAVTTSSQPSVAGTWLFSCCDSASTWVGMLALIDDAGAIRGVWITDGDSHGSYVEGHRDGSRVQLWRRWVTGSTRHEQIYELALDASVQHLNGSFREPAFEAAAHSIQLWRGFVPEPRRSPKPLLQTSVVRSAPDRDPNRPCDCGLVCYCGGVPPGASTTKSQLAAAGLVSAPCARRCLEPGLVGGEVGGETE